MAEFHAVIRQDKLLWIGWIEEVPGINCQARTREQLIEQLHSALKEAININLAEARKAIGIPFEEVTVTL